MLFLAAKVSVKQHVGGVVGGLVRRARLRGFHAHVGKERSGQWPS